MQAENGRWYRASKVHRSQYNCLNQITLEVINFKLLMVQMDEDQIFIKDKFLGLAH